MSAEHKPEHPQSEHPQSEHHKPVHPKAEHHHAAAVPPELLGLIADKQKESKEAGRSHTGNNLLSAAGGALTGVITGALAWMGSLGVLGNRAFKRTFGSVENYKKINQETAKLSIEEQQKLGQQYGETLGKHIIHAAQESDGLAAVARNPKTAVLVGAAVGAGYAYSKSAGAHAEAKAKADGELASLTSTAEKWQERVSQAEVVPGPQSHAIH